MALPSRPSGYPPPSQRSWHERTISPTLPRHAPNAIENELALDRVALDDLELTLSQRRRLVQDLLGDGDFSDVVQHGCELEFPAIPLGDPQLVGHGIHQLEHGTRMVRGVLVIELENVREDHHRASVGAVELQCGRVPLATVAGENLEQPDKRPQGDQGDGLRSGGHRHQEGDRRENRVDSSDTSEGAEDPGDRELVGQPVPEQIPQQVAGDLGEIREDVDLRQGERRGPGCQGGEHKNGTDRKPAVADRRDRRGRRATGPGGSRA